MTKDGRRNGAVIHAGDIETALFLTFGGFLDFKTWVSQCFSAAMLLGTFRRGVILA